MARRRRIRQSTQDGVLTDSRRRCCLCYGLNRDLGEKKGQIAHLDGNPANNDLDNLAWLCFDHHDQLDSRSKQGKGLTVGEAKRYRAELYQAVARPHEDRPAIRPPQPAPMSIFAQPGQWVDRQVNVAGDWIAPNTAGPTFLHQLPASPPDFTGREAELEDLQAALDSHGSATICGLRGLGGIGKTALALKLAEGLTERYPDAQIFLDLQGTGERPLTAAEAMAHVVRAYHPTLRLPESENELGGLYHSALRGQRALLLMDNAAGREQVEPLIPPAGCALLVTSRLHFSLPGLVSRDLDTLPPDDAKALLLRIAPRIGDECAGEIAHLCGSLPLALRLAGSLLAEREDMDPADYLRRLADAQTRLELVDASLSLSYDPLTAQLQRQWRLLAVFPGTFDRKAAAAVWELGPEPAQDLMSELVRYSLVEWDEAADRYWVHDLARLFADARLDPVERGSGQRRHAVHYAVVAGAAEKLYLQGGEALGRGLILFDMEWGNIQAGQAWTAAHSRHSRAIARLCSDYPSAAANCLSLRQRPRERIAWLEAAVAATRRLEDHSAEGAHLGNLGTAYQLLGQAERAIEYYEQALTISRQVGNRRGEGADLGNLGNYYAALGYVERAIKYYEQAMAINRQIGNRRDEETWLGNLGIAYAYLGQTERAIEYFEQALSISCEIGDRHGEGVALGNLGLAYADLGQVERAIEYHEQALAIHREIGYRRGEGIALGNLGLAYAALGQVKRAIEYYEQALAIHCEIGDRRGEETWLGSLGDAYRTLGEVGQAIEYSQQALSICREISNRGDGALRSWSLGLAYEEQGNLARAAAALQARVDYEREIGHPDAEEHAAKVAEVHSRIGLSE
jgi:tetratricopeptide (TPR) repeat protein